MLMSEGFMRYHGFFAAHFIVIYEQENSILEIHRSNVNLFL